MPNLKGWQDRARELLEEATGWSKRGNVGLRTGSISGIVVIDIDAGATVSLSDFPRTVAVETPRGGYHLYYRAPRDIVIGNSRKRLGLPEHVDMRGEGGQVVFPGSIHPDTTRSRRWAGAADREDSVKHDLFTRISPGGHVQRVQPTTS